MKPGIGRRDRARDVVFPLGKTGGLIEAAHRA